MPEYCCGYVQFETEVPSQCYVPNVHVICVMYLGNQGAPNTRKEMQLCQIVLYRCHRPMAVTKVTTRMLNLCRCFKLLRWTKRPKIEWSKSLDTERRRDHLSASSMLSSSVSSPASVASRVFPATREPCKATTKAFISKRNVQLTVLIRGCAREQSCDEMSSVSYLH